MPERSEEAGFGVKPQTVSQLYPNVHMEVRLHCLRWLTFGSFDGWNQLSDCSGLHSPRSVRRTDTGRMSFSKPERGTDLLSPCRVSVGFLSLYSPSRYHNVQVYFSET